MRTPSDYERRALGDIREWKTPERGWFGQTLQKIGWPSAADQLSSLIDNLGDAVAAVAGKSLAGMVRVVVDGASWSVSAEAIRAEFRKAGHDVHQTGDVFRLDLQDVDRTIGMLDAKYTSAAFAEGAAVGTLGIPGIVADVPALTALNLRAICEYATYYGFDLAHQRERLFVLHVLGVASSPDAAAKGVVMVRLANIASDAAKKKAWSALEKEAFVVVLQQIAKAVGVRLTKAKLAQVVPILGAAVGGGFNAYYTSRVCDSAAHLYRERFLAEKYGPELIHGASEETAGGGDSVVEGEGSVFYAEASEDPLGEASPDPPPNR